MNAQDKQKCTPLFYACSAGHSDVAQMLLQAGADANICNGTGERYLLILLPTSHSIGTTSHILLD